MIQSKYLFQTFQNNLLPPLVAVKLLQNYILTISEHIVHYIRRYCKRSYPELKQYLQTLALTRNSWQYSLKKLTHWNAVCFETSFSSSFHVQHLLYIYKKNNWCCFRWWLQNPKWNFIGTIFAFLIQVKVDPKKL